MSAIYQYLDLEISKVGNVNKALNEAINSYSSSIEEIEDKEEAISTLLDFLVIARTQMNLLHGAEEDLKKFNININLNGSRKPDNHLNPYSNNEFKMKQIAIRY